MNNEPVMVASGNDIFGENSVLGIHNANVATGERTRSAVGYYIYIYITHQECVRLYIYIYIYIEPGVR